MPLRRIALRLLLGALPALVAGISIGGCGGKPFSFVDEKVYNPPPTPPALRLVVAPFETGPSARRNAEHDLVPEGDAARKLARYLSEALAEEGYDVIPPDDLLRLLAATSAAEPRRSESSAATRPASLDLVAAAKLAATGFDAQALVSGRAVRYRERSGEELGSVIPASVAFVVSLHAVPGGERLWSASFDHTQQPLTEDPFYAARIPGAGTRWVGVDELANFGASELARSLAGYARAPGEEPAGSRDPATPAASEDSKHSPGR